MFAGPVVVRRRFRVANLSVRGPFHRGTCRVTRLPLRANVLPRTRGVNVEFRGVRVNVRHLTLILVLNTRTRINCLSPFTNRNFAVAILRKIRTVLFSDLRRASNVYRHFVVTHNADVFARPMSNRARDMGLLLNVRQVTFVIREPMGSTGFVIMRAISGDTFNAHDHFRVLQPPRRTMYDQGNPRSTNIRSNPLFDFKLRLLPTHSATMRATIRFVHRSVCPRKRSVKGRLLLRLLFRLLSVRGFLDCRLWIVDCSTGNSRNTLSNLR